MICVQWGNSLFLSVFIQQGSERVPGTLVLLSLWSDTDDSLFWHSSGVARFLSSIHALVCRVDKAAQVSLHQHRHLTALRFTPHGRLLRSRVIGLLTQTMRVNKTQRCFGLWEMSFLQCLHRDVGLWRAGNGVFNIDLWLYTDTELLFWSHYRVSDTLKKFSEAHFEILTAVTTLQKMFFKNVSLEQYFW